MEILDCESMGLKSSSSIYSVSPGIRRYISPSECIREVNEEQEGMNQSIRSDKSKKLIGDLIKSKKNSNEDMMNRNFEKKSSDFGSPSSFMYSQSDRFDKSEKPYSRSEISPKTKDKPLS